MDHRSLRLPKGCWWLAGLGFLAAGLPFTGAALWALVEAYSWGGWVDVLTLDPLGFATVVVGLWLIKFGLESLQEARKPSAGEESWRRIRAPGTDSSDPST